MLDKKERNKRIALRLLGHSSVMIPTGLGGSALILSLIAGIGGPFVLLGGLACILGGGAVLAYRFLFKLNPIAKETLEAMQEETEDAHRKRIQKIRDKLSSDSFCGDEALLDELMEMEEGFTRDKGWAEDIDMTTALQVMQRVDGIVETSIKLLERSFDLRQRARRMKDEARTSLLASSDQLLEQVRQSVSELGQIFAGVQRLSVQRLTGKGEAESDLKQNVKELHDLLGAAERAETRRQSILTGSEDNRYDEYLKS
ncbi:MAG TPA: hypothetical protein VI873_01055 [Candidatus Peribacteraceae bacterium]|nr:hypothetical protein [Candidatus Peribacteraceae bacterium]